MSLTVIAVAVVVAFVLVVLMGGWSLNRAMRRKSVPYQAQTTPVKEQRGISRKWVTALVIIVGIVALLVFVVIPAMKDSGVRDGSWQTIAVIPVSFVRESVTTSSAPDGSQWSNKCFIYNMGDNWFVASQDQLEIGLTYNIKGHVHKWTDGTWWLVEEARK